MKAENTRLTSLIPCIFLMIFVIGMPANLFAAEDPAAERQLLSLINQARSNPLMMVEMVGADAGQVLDCFSERQEVLKNGLRPLSINHKLAATASAHTAEMLESGNFTRISPDGRRPVERIAATGYSPLITGESIGIIGFNNLMPREKAVWELFKNLFLDELRCGGAEPWHILEPKFSEIGIRVATGTMDSGGQSINIYIATCDFATSTNGMYAAERNLLQLINTVRSHPGIALSYLGIDLADAFEALGRDGWVLLLGLPPLSANEDLFAAAGEMADGYGVELKNGTLPIGQARVVDVRQQLIDVVGLEISSASEALVTYPFSGGRNPSPGDGIFQLFLKMLNAELSGSEKGIPLTIFNSAYTELGVAYHHVNRLNAEGNEVYHGLLVCEFVEPATVSRHVVGQVTWIREDAEGQTEEFVDGGINGLMVQVFEVQRPSPDAPPVKISLSAYFTDPVGGFSIALPDTESSSEEYYLTITAFEGGADKSLYSDSFSHSHKRNLLKQIQLQKVGQ